MGFVMTGPTVLNGMWEGNCSDYCVWDRAVSGSLTFCALWQHFDRDMSGVQV
jgi:hypothetical protein